MLPENTKLTHLNGLAKRLVSDNLLSKKQALEACQYCAQHDSHLVSYLIQHGLADSNAIAMAASNEFGTPLLDLSAFDTKLLPRDLVDSELIRRHHALPLFRHDNRLHVAVSDPTNLVALDEFKFNTGTITTAILVEENKLTHAIETYFDDEENVLTSLNNTDLEALDFDETLDSDDDCKAVNETPVVRFINTILLNAIKSGASDIHFEPYEKNYRIRYRTDGVLHQVSTPPQSLAARFAARLKVMSRIDISERRIPQDGRIKIALSKQQSVDLRINTLPTLWGEKIVLRILNSGNVKIGIDALGYDDDQKKLYLSTLHQAQGMILVTGPTGSGKTVSLYTGLNILNTPARNISTVEDPVEINLEGINQVHVNHNIGVGFSTVLRAFLRQDPDIVMVGEIRDLETAEIAIKAAQTGHLVLSTLHTNSAPETLTRLRNMGVPAFNIATSVSLIISQRLIRKLCEHCKKPANLPQDTLITEGFTAKFLQNTKIMAASNGCQQCLNGYKGRIGIYEVVKVTPRISRIIMADGNSLEIAQQAQKEGFMNLRLSALKKVAQGITSLEEVNRVTKN